MAGPATFYLDDATERAVGNDWNALIKAQSDLAKKMGVYGLVDQGRLFHFDGIGWRTLDMPNNEVMQDAYVEDADHIWLVGTNGSILRGNARTGFQAIASIDGQLTFLSMTKLGSTYYLVSDYALHTFDGRTLSPLKPRVRRSPPTPFRVQAVDGVLFYFDYKQGVQRFDGQAWERIDIPPELLQRNFKGLKRPGP